MCPLGLRFEGVGGERVGREEIERELAAALRLACDTIEQIAAQARQIDRERGAGSRHQLFDGAIKTLPQCLRGRRSTRTEPREDLVALHHETSRPISRFRALASPSWLTSPTPADAKCGRPPLFPPVVAAMALAISPALIPLETRSSVTATWMPARSPVVNNTEIARLCFPRKPSMMAEIWSRSSIADSETCNSRSPIFSTCPDSPVPALTSSATRFSNFLFSSSIASIRRTTCSGCVFSNPDASDKWRCSSSAYRYAVGPVSASMRRTPAAAPVSCVKRNSAICPVAPTCVPPQSSSDTPRTSTTRTTSPYFSPNSAIAPAATASLYAICRVSIG